MDDATLQLLTMMSGAMSGIGLLSYVWVALALGAVFKKTGDETWAAWVPIYNYIVLLRRAGLSPALVLVALFPPPVLFLNGAIASRLNPQFGYSGAGMTVLGALLMPVWASIIGWGSAHWRGARAEVTPDGGYARGGYAPQTHLPQQMVPGAHSQGAPEFDAFFAPTPQQTWNNDGGYAPHTHHAQQPAQPGVGNVPQSNVDQWAPEAAPGAAWRPAGESTSVTDSWIPMAPPASAAEVQAAPQQWANEADAWAPTPDADQWDVAPAEPAPQAGWDPSPEATVVVPLVDGPQASVAPSEWDSPAAADQWTPAPHHDASAPAVPGAGAGADAWTPAPQPQEPVAWDTPAVPEQAGENSPVEQFENDQWRPAQRRSTAWDVPSEGSLSGAGSDAAAWQSPAVEEVSASSDEAPRRRTGEVRMREDAEVVAQARAAMAASTVPPAQPEDEADDGPVAPIVVPGPSGHLPGVVPPPAIPGIGSVAVSSYDEPWEPARRSTYAPLDTSLDLSEEVSAVAGAPYAGTPRSALSSVSALHPDAGVPDDEDPYEATEIAVRHRPSFSLITPAGETISLTSSVVLLGRKPSADRTEGDAQIIPIADVTRTVSKKHARLELNDGAWTLTDLGSTNGVVVFQADGAEIEGAAHQPLTVTERFLLGDAELKVVSTSS